KTCRNCCAVTAPQKPKPQTRSRWRTGVSPVSHHYPRCRTSEDVRAHIYSLSAGRPLQISSTQQMHVQMKHRLACARPHVQHSAITVFNAAVPRHPGGRKMTEADDFRVFGRGLLQAANV